LHIFA